jgi:hypothetical protein
MVVAQDPIRDREQAVCRQADQPSKASWSPAAARSTNARCAIGRLLP